MTTPSTELKEIAASVDDLFEYTRYINLDGQPERKEHIISQINNLGINACRHPATKGETRGSYWVAQSHIEILALALQQTPVPKYVCILEDDANFHHPRKTLEQATRVHANHPDWDVMLLGGDNHPPFTKRDEDCVQVTKCFQSHAYLVRDSFISKLKDKFVESLQLIKTVVRSQTSRKLPIQKRHLRGLALDQKWMELMLDNKFLLLTPVAVTQKLFRG